MSQGYARFEMEERTAGGSPVPSSGVRFMNDRTSRDALATVSYPDAETLPAFDLGDHPCLLWCVDHGDQMATMTTFELWMALDRRAIPRHLLVWREGMECWTPAGEVPELRWALASVPPAPMVEEPPAVFETTPAAATTEATTNPALRGAPPGEAAIDRHRAPARGPFWMGLGSAVAALAIAVALAATSGAAPAPEAPLAVPSAPSPPTMLPTRVGEDIPVTTTPEPKPARREEPGQRRRRQGAHGGR